MESPESQRFESIKSSFTDKTRDIISYKADDAYKIIIDNIKRFEKLKATVENSQNIADVLPEVANELSHIASNYRKVADMAGDIKSNTITSMDELNTGNKASKKSVAINDARINKLSKEITDAELKLPKAKNSNETIRLQATINGNKSMINSLKGQNLMWRNFQVHQERLLGSLNDNNGKVSTLLFVLEKNADVYELAAETAQMTKSASQFIQNLNGLMDINNTLDDLQESWTELDLIVDEIATLDFSTL